MADENKFLHLGNSNDKILYDKFKGKLEKKDIATNNKLLQIFNFFDKDGNGIIETANSKGVNEMQSLWNAVRTSATKNSNSIFEDSEAQEFLVNSVDSTGKSLADNQVTASDLFGFLKALVTPQATQTNLVKPEDIVEYTPEEIEDISIQTVTDGVKQAREVFDAQKTQQGAVSDLVDGTKEAFDTQYASSRVNRYLMNEEFCVQALQQAQEGNLTEKEYLEAKIELAVRMLPELQSKELKSTIIKQILTFGLYKDFGNKTKAEQERIVKELEIEYLKEALKNLTPEELTVFIKKVTSLSDEEYKEHAPKAVENLINQTIQKKEFDNRPVLKDSSQVKIINPPRQGSIEDILSHQDAYRVMEFEETFSKERGVEYNPEAIMNYSTKEAQLQFLVGMHNRNEAIKNILHDATVAVDGNNKYGAPHHDAIETCNQNLANQIETAFRSLYSKNAAEAQKVIDEIMGQDSGIKVVADEKGNFIKLEFYGFKRNSLNLDLLGGTKSEGATQESQVGFENNKFRMPVNAYSLVHLSKGLQQKLEDNYQTALNGKTLDDYSAEVKSAYQMAYGAKNAQDMANAFAQSQQEGVQNTKAVVQGLGMVAMVAGQLIPVGGQVATALVMGGMATSTLGSVGVSALENYTKAGGPTEEDKKAMLQELGTSLALVGSGMGIGKGSEAIFRTLVMKNCPKLIAFAAEVGVDATASLLADYAITGQIDLSGESIAQLQNILVGIIGAKGARNYLNTHAGEFPLKTVLQENKTYKIDDSNTHASVSHINDSDIVPMTRADIDRLKSNNPNIKEMPDGTVIKVDNEGTNSVIGRLYQKATHTAKQIIVKLSSRQKLLESTSTEAHFKLLVELKDATGKQIFENSDISKLLNVIPDSLNIKGQDLISLMTLKDISVDDAIQIFSKIDSQEKLEILKALTSTNDRDIYIKYNKEVPENEINFIEIDNILENLKDSNVSNLGQFFRDAISCKYNEAVAGDVSLSTFLTRMSFDVKSDLQKEAFYTVIRHLDPSDSASEMYYSALFNDIIDNIKTEEDLIILSNAFKNQTRVGTASWTFEIIVLSESEQKSFLSNVLQKIRDNNNRDSSFDVYKTIANLSYERNNANLTNDVVLDMISNKVPLEDVYTLVQNSSTDSSHLIYERMKNNQFDYDLGSLADISYSNNFQKEAFTTILNNNKNRRFEALAVKDILNCVNDEKSLKLLNKLLENENADTHTIIESLKQGRIIERPNGKLKNTQETINVVKAEQEIAQIIGLNNSNITSDIRNAISCHLENLVKLNAASPKRFKKMIDCGLFDLIKEGKISANILKNIDDNTFLSNRTLNDIKKIKEGKPVITTLSSQKDLSDISNHIPNGDVCEFNGKLYVNENGTATEIKLSKEKFEELFPPLTSVSFEQGSLGDCWLVTTLDNFMDLPNGRISLYKLFEQQGDDILIKFPNGTNPIKFDQGIVLDAYGKQISGIDSEVPLGIQMIEQAYAIHRYSKYDNNAEITEISAHSTNVTGLMKELRGGWQYEASREILGDYYATTDSYGINLGNREKMKEYIELYANNENVLTFFATRDIPGGDSSMLSRKYDLAGRHAYSIKGYNKETGMVYITNPWHTSVITEVPLYELMKYIDDVNFAHFNKNGV